MSANDPSIPTQQSADDFPEIQSEKPTRDDPQTPRSTGRTRDWTPPTPEELTRLLSNFRIEKFLGRGGMGAVYHGVQLVLERPVAIKILPAEIADDEFIARFQREARMLARLQHPGIVGIYDFGQTSEGHLYLVMEFVNGMDLSQMIRSRALSPTQALEITVQICEALHYAHGQGVIHRDVKPANILVTKDGRAKLADFGLARPLSDEPGTLMVSMVARGTPDYMAPEQREGRADNRTDIYSLGVLLYEMLTGKRPKGVFDPPSFKVKVDVRLDQVVIKALQQEPERRYQLVSEMGTDVDKIRRTPPSQAKPPVVPPAAAPKQVAVPIKSGSRTWKNNPLALGAAIVLPVLAVGGLFVWDRMHRIASTSGKEPNDAQVAASHSAVVDLSRGLVSWWKADGDARDSAGNNHGTLHGDVSFADGLFGKAFLFSGGHVEIPDSPALHFGPESQFTINVWTFRTGESLPFHIFGKRGGGGNDPGLNGYQLGIDGSGPETPVKEWVCWTLVADGKRQSLYINGVWILDWNKPRPASSAPLRIGRSGDYAPFYGLVDDLRIYNRVMSDAEIKTMVEFQKPSTSATKDQPFTNSLGMKFVPVPITGGPTDGKKVLFSISDTRVQDYEVFAKVANRDWQRPSFTQGPTHPAVMVSWEDATDFCAWLTDRERNAGKLGASERYRLPSDHEWSCAVGIGEREDAAKTPEEKNCKIDGIWPWGVQWPPPERSGNFADASSKAAVRGPDLAAGFMAGYEDGFVYTSPVDSFSANRYGLCDMAGNVWQWCEDSNADKKSNHALRGSAWDCSGPLLLLASARVLWPATDRHENHGFRCVLVMEDISKAGKPTDAAAAATFTTTNKNGQVIVTGYTGPGGAVDIPRYINGLPVVRIENAFYANKSLTGVTIPGSVTSIGGRAFLGTSLTSIMIPNWVNRIEWQAFCGATLTSVTIPDSVTSIHQQAFCWCPNLASVTIPNSVTEIGFWAFRGCPKLTSITIPSSVTSINHAFGDCASLASITVDAQNSAYSSVDGVLFDKNRTTLIAYPAGRAGTSYTIPDSVTSIADWAFADCKNLTSVPIPKSVTSIGEGAFSGCISLTAITVAAQHPTFSGVGGVLFDGNRTTLIEYPAGKPGGSYTVPDGVTTIGKNSFHGCGSLTSIGIPDSVTRIEDGAFYACAGLTTVTIPNSVTSLGNNVFTDCKSLTSAVFSGNAPGMGKDVFSPVPTGFTVSYPKGATGFSSPVWKDSSGDEYPAVVNSAPNPTASSMKSSPQTADDGPGQGTPVTLNKMTATKDRPWENSLGMKFVPVPITGGPTDGWEVLFSIWDTRVQDYEIFAKATYHTPEKPDFEQGPTHPVVNVSWNDAQAFCAWLTERDRAKGILHANYRYRLPSDHEWSCAVGIGDREDAIASPKDKDGKIDNAFPWGTLWSPPRRAGNYKDEAVKRERIDVGKYLDGYDDGFIYTSPVGSSTANQFGLYDLGGNVWQWCEDWYSSEHLGRVTRGASYLDAFRDVLLSAYRLDFDPNSGSVNSGFRCVLAPQ